MKNKLVILSSQSHSLANFRYHMLRDFIAADVCVNAWAPKDSYFTATKAKLDEIGVTLEPVALNNTGLNPLQDAALFFTLRRHLQREKPDMAFFYTIKPVIYGCFAAKSVKVPKIYAMISGLGYLFTGKSYKQRILRQVAIALYRRALTGIDKVFFHNSDDANLFLQLNIVKPSQSVVIGGSGVDIDYFSPLPYPATITFLFAGRLIRDKGIYEFVAAARKIKEDYPQIRFLIAGGLHDNPSALSRSALNELINDGTVEYLGEVADIRTALKQASVFVLPSYREGLSRASLEALATARPIITTDAPGCREVVPGTDNGYKVPVGDVEALVQAMYCFIQDPEKIPRMGMAGRELAVTRFSISTINRTILESMQLMSL